VRERVELHGEWSLNAYDTPFVPERLRTHGYSAEASLSVVPGGRAAVRWSELLFGEVRDGAGRLRPWDADARRLEAGLVWRFFQDGAAVKAVYQRTEVDREPRRVEDLYALQLAISR